MSSQLRVPSRPGSVTGVAVLFVVGAVLQFITAGLYAVLAIRPGEIQEFYGAPISDWYWILAAMLSGLLGFIYLWVARQQLAGDPQSWMLANILMVINLFFALFSLAYGTGCAVLALNAVALVLNNTRAAREYFGVGGPSDHLPPGAA
ncbi:MAG: hypothetical protein U0990_04235 [Candidatus Nanopelagicales bacterium]|nr:hypothetical protein [Candidatus Nanopelagicales bacterium]MDZ4249279.1 hypothetical protein [Candidatus Nanopelagicales bacterium]